MSKNENRRDNNPANDIDFESLYDLELGLNKALVEEVDQKNDQIKELEEALSRIKDSKIWKMSKPFRVVYFKLKYIKDRMKVYGVKGSVNKAIMKTEKNNIYKSYGTASFPTPEERKFQSNYQFSKDITFSILVPLYNTPENFLKDMIDSVIGQTYEKWELCLADGSDEEHSYVKEICDTYMAGDSRIKYRKIENKGISENTNVCIDMSTGEYISLFDHDDILHPSVLFENMKVICSKNADYIYTDETTFEGDSINNIITLHFKPDFAIDNLRANNYICHFSTFSRALLDKGGMFRKEYDGSQDHDLVLRLTSAADKVCHIPKILYYWRSHQDSVASDINAKTYAIDAAKNAVKEHLEKMGLEAEVMSSRAFPTIFRFKYKIIGKPLISIIIPNKDHVNDLTRCIRSIAGKSTYQNYEIIIVENNSKEDKTFEYYKALEQSENIRVVKYEGDFNYSKINNYGVSFAKGDYLILLNNDTEVIEKKWMEELLMYAQREDVGAVGGKLFYSDDTIQHAGIVLGMGADRVAGHVHYKLPKESIGYMGRLWYAQDMTAVTGACLMVRKELYELVKGLDEGFAVAFNDVDFCIKLRQEGYLNIFNPYAELYHYESKSRGYDSDTAKVARFKSEAKRFKEKWNQQIQAGDEYFNPNFHLDYSDFIVKECGKTRNVI